jgi:hypothetical protein
LTGSDLEDRGQLDAVHSVRQLKKGRHRGIREEKDCTVGCLCEEAPADERSSPQMAKTVAILTVDGDAQSGSLRTSRVTLGVRHLGRERGNDALLQRLQHVYLVLCRGQTVLHYRRGWPGGRLAWYSRI